MSTEDYKVTIGEEVYSVKADDNLSAKYEAAAQFRDKHGLNSIPLSEIAEYARAKLVTPFEPTTTTEKVLRLLRSLKEKERRKVGGLMPCKLQEAGVCDCPGGEGYEPVKGLIYLDNGVRCLDFDKLIPYHLAFVPRKLPGGRHITDTKESMDKLDKARRKYQKSDKGKATRRKWRDSEKGQKSVKKNQDSPRFKLSKQKYLESQKGQKALERGRERRKDWRKAAKWLEEHPGKTLEDYYKEADSDG